MARFGRLLPWIAAAVAIATVAGTLRRKGLLRGAVDVALNATPVIGGFKIAAERLRGRDFITDRPSLAAGRGEIAR